MLAGVSSPACLACLLALASIEDRERAKSGGLGFENYINQIVKEKYKVYIPTSPQAFYKFILSIHPLARKKGGGGTNQTERLTCALRAVQAKKEEIHPREGYFTACYYLQQGKTRTNNQIADSEQEFDMYEPRSRRERTPSKKKRWTKKDMDEATYIERYLTSWIPHTLTFLSRSVCFFVLQFFPKTHFREKLQAPRTVHAPHTPATCLPNARQPQRLNLVLVDANGVPDSCLRWHYSPGPQEEEVLSVCERAPRV